MKRPQCRQGAADVMRNERLLALCVELDGHGARYGYDEPALHARFLALGFAPYRYHPFDRRLEQLSDALAPSGNVLYLRTTALAEIRRRLASATAFEVLGRRI